MNVVIVAQSRLPMGSVDHVENDVYKMDRLGVLLVDSNEGGVIIHNGPNHLFYQM